MSLLLLLLDVRVDPAGRVPWGGLLLLLGIVFVLALAFVASLVALLIRRKRRNAKDTADLP